MQCSHPTDVSCSACPRDAVSPVVQRAASIEAQALGSLWYGGDSGHERYAALMREHDATLAKQGCLICDGGDQPPCSAECAELALRAQAVVTAREHFAAARKAIRLVKQYRDEGDGLESPRLLATLARFGELREMGRAMMRRSHGQ